VSSASEPVLLASRYRLEELLATGDFGGVWRAEDVLLRRPVAVKLLDAARSGHPETLARFRAEARHAAALCQENIARVYDYDDGLPDGPPYLVMELVPGPSLARVLARGALDPARVMDIVAQAAAGLAAAHEAGLVHRDIKPGNLLLGPGGLVKITNFGLSHAVGSGPAASTGPAAGTAGYLAPERAAGAEAVPASDLYSLGVVAYECLAGPLPSPGDVGQAAPAQPLPPLPASLPGDVAALVGELIADDPAARPASAADVAGRAARLRDELTGGVTAPIGVVLPQGRPGLAAPGLPGRRRPPVAFPGRRPAPRALRSLDAGLAARILDTGPAPRPGQSPRPGPAPSPGQSWLPGQSRPPGPAWRPGSSGQAGQAWQPGHTWLPGRNRHAGWGTGQGRRPGSRSGRGRLLVLPAAVLVAALSGLVLASTPGGAPAPRPGAVPTRTSTGRHVLTVEVRGGSLVGKPVGAVVHRLHRLGLQARVRWRPSDGQSPGTVMAVQPAGQLPAGSRVTVIGAFQPRNGDERGQPAANPQPLGGPGRPGPPHERKAHGHKAHGHEGHGHRSHGSPGPPVHLPKEGTRTPGQAQPGDGLTLLGLTGTPG
jgi:eukaryotic-like serine/threonine-protein kinase